MRRIGVDLRDVARSRRRACSRSSSRPTAPIACRSLGIAREVAAITGAPLTPPRRIEAHRATVTRDARSPHRRSAACPRFCARASSKASTPRAPTPAWMQAAPRAQRHPLDLGRRRHHQLRDARARAAAARLRRCVARRRRRRALRARPARQLTLLNGQTCSTSTADLLLVADEKKPLGLAGIMGGEHSGIGDDTTQRAFSKARSGIRRSSRARRAGWASRPMPDFASSAASISPSARRAVDRATH